MSTPTHAGAVVYRGTPGAPQFLPVTALRKCNEWILSKGHIEPGEAPEQAATGSVPRDRDKH